MMAAKVLCINPQDVSEILQRKINKVLLVDSRSFLEYNDCHIVNAVNVCCSKLVKRRLQQDKVSMRDFLIQNCHIDVDESYDVVVYDQATTSVHNVAIDSFLHVLLQKLVHLFQRVFLLSGGFLEFQACYRDLCEDKSRRCPTLTSLSQPCMPISNVGPTRILPFLYLGSQQDANNKELLQNHNIIYEVNVSTTCPKPDFIQDGHFLRVPVNDNYGEKLLPYFVKATQFVDKVREANGCVLVHCLAGISRSPTVAIAYVMRHLRLTFDDAFRYVKSKRPTISPNFNFLGQLLEYERQLRAEDILDNELASGMTSAPVQLHPVRCTFTGTRKTSVPSNGFPRSASLSLSLKPMETVTASPDHSPEERSKRQPLTDLSPTTALSRLSFGLEDKESEEPVVMVTRQRHSESYTHQRSFKISDKKGDKIVESRSHMVLTVSKRVSSPPSTRVRWRDNRGGGSEESVSDTQENIKSEISIRFPCAVAGEKSQILQEEVVQIRTCFPPIRPCSDNTSLCHQQQQRAENVVPRRASYAEPEDDITIPLSFYNRSLCPPWTYARSDSVTTSGLGSELSDLDSVCGSFRMDAENIHDDGVFTEHALLFPTSPPPESVGSSSYSGNSVTGRSTRPRPSSLMGIVPAVDHDLHCKSGEVGDGGLGSTPLFPKDFGKRELEATGPSEDPRDSATVFRFWKEREAGLHDRSPVDNTSKPLAAVSRRHKEFASSGRQCSEKRKSCEIPQSFEKQRRNGDPSHKSGEARVAGTGTPETPWNKVKTRVFRAAGTMIVPEDDGPAAADGLLYRVHSCPGIFDVVDDGNPCQTLRATAGVLEVLHKSQIGAGIALRKRVMQEEREKSEKLMNRYSCGSIDQPVRNFVENCIRNNNNDTSLNGLSVVQVS